MDLKHVPRVSSGLKAVDLVQIPAPLIIGERLNTQGSKKAKKLVLSDDFDGLIDLGREQVNDGAHCIDVCVATTERSDELEFMKKLVKRLSLEIDAPLVIDSTDPKVITEAINQIPGRPRWFAFPFSCTYNGEIWNSFYFHVYRSKWNGQNIRRQNQDSKVTLR